MENNFWSFLGKLRNTTTLWRVVMKSTDRLPFHYSTSVSLFSALFMSCTNRTLFMQLLPMLLLPAGLKKWRPNIQKFKRLLKNSRRSWMNVKRRLRSWRPRWMPPKSLYTILYLKALSLFSSHTSLFLQVELARAEEKGRTLTEENIQLLARWKQKSQEDAKKMNVANEFYHQMLEATKRNQLLQRAEEGVNRGLSPGQDPTVPHSCLNMLNMFLTVILFLKKQSTSTVAIPKKIETRIVRSPYHLHSAHGLR